MLLKTHRAAVLYWFGNDDHSGILTTSHGDDYPLGLYANLDTAHSKRLLSGHLLAQVASVFSRIIWNP